MTVPTRDKIDRFHRSTNDNGSHPSRRYHSTISSGAIAAYTDPCTNLVGRDGRAIRRVSAGRRLCCTAEPHRHMTMPWPKKKRKENPLHLRYPRALRGNVYLHWPLSFRAATGCESTNLYFWNFCHSLGNVNHRDYVEEEEEARGLE